MKTPRKTRSSRRHSQVAIVRALIFFFLFLGLEFVLEHKDELHDGEPCDAAQADAVPWQYESMYPWLIRHLTTRPSTDQVRVVYIPEELDEVQQNVCRGRAYLAALVDALRLQQPHPRAIVLDKFFSGTTCKATLEEQAQSRALQNAVNAALAAKIAIVVGKSTGSAGVETGGSCLVAKPEANSFFTSPPVTYGLTKLNANREQLPLNWLVLNAPQLDPSSHQPLPLDPKPQPQPSLALAAATVVDRAAGTRLDLATASTLSRHPYVQLDDVTDIPSTDLVSRSSAGPASNTTSAAVSEPAYVATPGVSLEALYARERSSRTTIPPAIRPGTGTSASVDPANKVVLVGSRNAVDRWLVLGRRRWGYELQADYLDALLSGSYRKALPGYSLSLLFAIFLLVVEAVPVIAEYLFCERHLRVPSVLRKATVWPWIWCPLFIVGLYAACSLGGYLPPLSVLMSALLLLATRAVFNGMEYFQKQSVPDRKESES